DILEELYGQARFKGGEKKSVVVGTDSVRFNADNFELAAVERRLPFQVVTTAYETELNTLLPLVNASAFFIYKEGGERVSPFNIRAGDAVREVREGGNFVELPMARALPDGGIAHVFANRSPTRYIRGGAFL